MMQLYSSPRVPRPEPFYTADHRTPASAYRLQAHLCRAYLEVLREWWNLDALILACFGERTGKRLQAAENRLEHKVIELLQGMEPVELERATQVFCQQTLVGFVWYVLAQEVSIDYRLKDGGCTTRLSDEKYVQAASLGQGTWKRGQLYPQPVPCACAKPRQHAAPPMQVPLPVETASAVTALPQEVTPLPVAASGPVAPLPAQALHYRVKRAQERRRLKRKRR
ncbi:hypothetical protein [uncultured Hymenobacter sp.]|uniref:hypothetical protein n=1 Tax=uncultured Hymenobacter sp. TaxID=170016 RepID=UPI0035CB61D3